MQDRITAQSYERDIKTKYIPWERKDMVRKYNTYRRDYFSDNRKIKMC